VLAGWHPVELGGTVVSAAITRAGIDPELVEDVIVGCVTQVGAQSMNVGRNMVLAAGLPETIPATTVDRQCGSSQQAIHFAAQGVVAGAYDVVVAAGVECMSTVPMFSNADANLGDPYGPDLRRRYERRNTFGINGIVTQGISAEAVARQFQLSREDLDVFALRSHERAAIGRAEGAFLEEVIPVPGRSRNRETGAPIDLGEVVTLDEGIRNTSLDRLGRLKPAFAESGMVTAGNSSQISDGAAAMLIVEEQRAAQLGLRPLARVASMTVAAGDPLIMLTTPIPATTKLLQRAGLEMSDIDLYEVNEAFASVPLAWMQTLDADPDRMNVNGGAIALGHPLGASGARLMTTLVHTLRRRNGRLGLQTMCEGGGMANATLIEAC
jgi:acetyl-CoA acetyltransferase family protein